MQVIWVVLLLVFLLCFFVYQWWFEQSRYRQMTEKRKAKVQWYSRPVFWLLLSVGAFFALLTIIAVHLARVTEALMELNG